MKDDAAHTTIDVLSSFQKPYARMLLPGLCLATDFSLSKDFIPFGFCSLSCFRKNEKRYQCRQNDSHATIPL